MKGDFCFFGLLRGWLVYIKRNGYKCDCVSNSLIVQQILYALARYVSLLASRF